MDSIFQVQAVEDRMPIGIPGGWVDTRPFRSESYVNASPLATQRATLTVDSHVADEVLSVVINGVTISVTNPASAGSTSTSAAALAAAINAEKKVSGQVKATASSADVIIDSTWPGVAFTITEGETNLSLVATTANAVAVDVPYGSAVIGERTDGTKGTLRATLADEDLLAFQVTHATPVIQSGNVSETHSLFVEVMGRVFGAHVATASATTVQAVVEAVTAELNSLLDAAFGAGNSIAVTEDNAKAILTAEIKGLAFRVWGATGQDSASLWTIADITKSALTDGEKAFRGVAIAQLAGPVTTTGTAAYPGQSTMEVGEEGAWWVTVETAVVERDNVYYGVGAGHEGKWRNTPSGNDYIGLPFSRAHFETAAAAGGLSALVLK